MLSPLLAHAPTAPPARQRELLVRLGRPDHLRRLLELIAGDPGLAGPIAANSFSHALGFDKFVLSTRYPHGQLRLHVWWPDTVRVREHIHNHRFAFSSVVVAGSLLSRIYRPSASGPRLLHLRDSTALRAERWTLEPADPLAVDTALTMDLTPGLAYSLRATTLHRIVAPEGLAVTLFLESCISRDHSSILVDEESQLAEPAPRRYFTEDRLREAFITLAHALC